ncbi:MAG: ComEC/Rec2 family competence protein [Hyphomonadaceae bacterium]|nr:ComEC/Rec2 family competence protein [Hyphomonadaceae bacterium]
MGSAWALQHDRWALWPPVATIGGAAAWMTAPTTPSWFWAPLLCGGSVVVALVLASWAGAGRGRGRMTLAALTVMSAAFGLGATAAAIRTAAVAAPRLAAEVGPVRLTGWVMDVEPGTTRPRMRVLVDTIDGVAEPPRFARVSVRVDGALPPGRALDCLVILRPPEGPLAPRAYDFARRAYFQQIGAAGFALGRCRPTGAGPPPSALDRAMLAIASWRRDLTDTVYEMAPNEGGAIAAAMITGDRSLMSEETNIAFRDSGLGHMLSVSGLHMALVAGGVYGAAHFLLALIGPLALRFPIRKWAAGAALSAGAIYLVISGASVPAQRAFVMTAVALGAVLLDRPAFTLRALGVAAVLVVMLAPESVVDAGFQMSFAATAALVAAFEARRREEGPAAPGLLLGGLAVSWRTLSDMLLASLVAGLATDPFAIYHFQRVAVYGLASNLASTPLITFVIAPAAVAAAALAPFGLAEPALLVMAGGLDMVRAIGAVFAERPEAVRALPMAPTSAFLFAIGAITWICLWRGGLRWWGVAGLVVAGALYALTPRPVVMADGDLRAVVALTQERWVAVADPRRGAFARSRLAGLLGLSSFAADRLAPPDGCTPDLCLWRTPGGRPVARVFTAAGMDEACLPGTIVLSDALLDRTTASRCRLALLVTPQDLERNGGLAITESARGVEIARARDDAGRRPWSGDLRRSGE